MEGMIEYRGVFVYQVEGNTNDHVQLGVLDCKATGFGSAVVILNEMMMDFEIDSHLVKSNSCEMQVVFKADQDLFKSEWEYLNKY